jgi:hypothetical protein
VGDYWAQDMRCSALGAGRVVWPFGVVATEEIGEDRGCCRGELSNSFKSAVKADSEQLSTQLLLTHPPLLLLSPLLLAVFAFTSLPFLTMVVRLGMIGYWRHP